MHVLIPLPATDFDPTETAVPWKILKSAGHTVTFATPSGQKGIADQRMLTGSGLGIWKKILMANQDALLAYQEMEESSEFKTPMAWEKINPENFQALLLPGGHAPGMKEYLESKQLQFICAEMVSANRPVAAICHGVVLLARSMAKDGKSVLFKKRTTSLLKSQEMMAWAMTGLWLGNYYRTYPEKVQDEVMSNLADPQHFQAGPLALMRDSPSRLNGFFVRDGNYLSARWPGDAHTFAYEFLKMLK